MIKIAIMVKIRFAKDEEVKNIFLNLEKLWKEERISPNAILSSRKDIEKAIDEKRVLVAVLENKIVGFLLYKFWNKNSCELDSVYVIGEFRKRGIGKRLVEKFLTLKPIRECKKIWVHADSIEEEKLLRFYNQFGFKKVAITMLKEQ